MSELMITLSYLLSFRNYREHHKSIVALNARPFLLSTDIGKIYIIVILICI